MRAYDRKPEPFQDVDIETWNNWTWQHQNRLTKEADFAWLNLTDDERAGFRELKNFRVAVTPHYASLINADDENCPVRRQALPHIAESHIGPGDLVDPLAEEAHMPVPGITHRYPDRVLFYVTHHCPVYCRHCTRKRKVSDPTTAASTSQIERGLQYIKETESVRDVLVSGGDPLSLSDEKLDAILGSLRKIEHVEVIRVGTRNPVTLPQRVTPELADIFREHGPIYLHTHFNHASEWCDESAEAITLLRGAGCVLGNQQVLLKGVNDSPEAVFDLCRVLLKAGCRPYYMLHCDFAEGVSHFRTKLETGVEIIESLRGRIGGMGIPDFVVDLPGGGGKIELVPNYESSRSDDEVSYRNYLGELFDVSN